MEVTREEKLKIITDRISVLTKKEMSGVQYDTRELYAKGLAEILLDLMENK